MGLGPARVRRDQLPRHAPRSLNARQQVRYLRAAERLPQARDRAIARLLCHTVLRSSELTALDPDDVQLPAHKGKVIVRAGKGWDSRQIPLLDPSVRTAAHADRAWQFARGGRVIQRDITQLSTA